MQSIRPAIRVADLVFMKAAQESGGLEGSQGAETASPSPAQAPPGGASGGSVASQQQGDAAQGQNPIYPLSTQPLPTIIDRKYEIRVMMKNFSAVAVLVTEKIHMLDKLMRSNGKDVKGFLDDPSVWDDKQWHECVTRTKRLKRDANEILMTTRDETPDMPDKNAPLPRRPDESSARIHDKTLQSEGFGGMSNMGGV